jgi:Fur family transcriptional regulator, zinc uptake regulator
MLAFTARGRLPLELYVSRGSEAGVQWTLLRKTVLQMLWGTGTPLGAYEAAERLSSPGCRVHPTSVYRCLHCLVKARLVLPIISWKKFLISPDPDNASWAVLLCRSCRSCTPVDLTVECAELDQGLASRRFSQRIMSAECQGLCSECSGERSMT